MDDSALSLWRRGRYAQQLHPDTIKYASDLVEALMEAPEILSRDWMFIGRQEDTGTGQRADLIAIARDGALIQVEVALHRPASEALVALVSCSEWLASRTQEDTRAMYARLVGREDLPYEFARFFETEDNAIPMSTRRQAVIVTGEADERTVRAVESLNSSGISMSVAVVRCFCAPDTGDRFLAREWVAG